MILINKLALDDLEAQLKRPATERPDHEDIFQAQQNILTELALTDYYKEKNGVSLSDVLITEGNMSWEANYLATLETELLKLISDYRDEYILDNEHE